MADQSCDIVVVGAGVLGLCVAAELTLRGHDVLVVDPGARNASSVAAGMIAPAFESLLDDADAVRAALLRDAAALWPDFAHRTGVVLDPTPAEWVGADAADVALALERLGFPVLRAAGRIAAPTDIRVGPEAALRALANRLIQPVLVAEATSMTADESGLRVQTTLGVVAAAQVVIATGAAAALAGLPPAVQALVEQIQPIAGQIGRFEDTDARSVRRGRQAYVVADGRHALIGATMVPGRDVTLDPKASARLTTAAEAMLGHSVKATVDWVGGVRGATPDGLPMAGPTASSGIHLALAPRRNGWLLGPLVARIVADGVEARPCGAHAAALDPMRF